MENFKQDLDIPNSESNSETEFSRQVEECQSNLYRIEKLFFNLQRDSQRLLRKSQDSLAKSFSSNKNKFGKRLNEQAPMQELHTSYKAHDGDQLRSNNNSELEHDTPASAKEDMIKNNSSSPLTFVVQVPSSIVDDFKKNVSSSEFLNFLSQSSSQNFKIKKKKGIGSLFQNLFRKKKNNVPPNLNTLLLKNIKFIKFLTESDQNEKKLDERSNESKIDQTSVTETTSPIENNTDINLSNSSKNSPDNNSSDGQTLVIPINFNSNTNIQEHVKSNFVIQHEIAPTNHCNHCSHTIKITNEPLLTCHSVSQCPSKVIGEKEETAEKELDKTNLDKLQSENHLMKNFIDNLLRSTENLNNLEILKIVVEILHEEKLKRKPSYCMDYCNAKVKNDRESNFLHNFLQQLIVELQNKSKQVDKDIAQAPKRQSSKISICPSTGGFSSEDDYFEKPIVLKSKRFHKSKRCQSPSMMKYRFCQSEKEFDKTE